MNLTPIEAPCLSIAQAVLGGTLQEAVVLTPVQAAAYELYDLGFNIGPTRPANAPDPKDRKLPFAWRRLVTTRIAREYIPELFDNQVGIFVMTGRLSMNLAVLDCETPSAAETHAAEFRRRGIAPWIVSTARGEHFYWLSANGEVANVAPDKTGGEWEIRGNGKYCLAPPSVHPTGVIYDWVSRPGRLPPILSNLDLDWLPLTPKLEERRQFVFTAKPFAELAQATRDFIDNGAPEGQRNNRLFKAACDMAGNDYTEQTARDLLFPPAKKSGLSHREIEITLRSAFASGRKPRTPSKPESVTHPRKLPTYLAAAAFADRHHWTRMTGEKNGRPCSVSPDTARRVFVAICERSRRDNAEVFRASAREIAELAAVTPPTAQAALACFHAAGLIRPRGYSKVGASLFAFGRAIVEKENAQNLTVPPPGSVSSVKFCAFSHPAFLRGALGATAERCWKAILTEPAKAGDLAVKLGVSASSVRRALNLLADNGLAEKTGKIWRGNPAGTEKLDSVAHTYDTLTLPARRKERFSRERAVYASRLILNSKRRWEAKNS